MRFPAALTCSRVWESGSVGGEVADPQTTVQVDVSPCEGLRGGVETRSVIAAPLHGAALTCVLRKWARQRRRSDLAPLVSTLIWAETIQRVRRVSDCRGETPPPHNGALLQPDGGNKNTLAPLVLLMHSCSRCSHPPHTPHTLPSPPLLSVLPGLKRPPPSF